MARLTSTADLRGIISEPRASTRAKILDALDEQSIDFLKRCPFALVGTTAADGTIEVSPKGDEPGFTQPLNVTVLASSALTLVSVLVVVSCAWAASPNAHARRSPPGSATSSAGLSPCIRRWPATCGRA